MVQRIFSKRKTNKPIIRKRIKMRKKRLLTDDNREKWLNKNEKKIVPTGYDHRKDL